MQSQDKSTYIITINNPQEINLWRLGCFLAIGTIGIAYMTAADSRIFKVMSDIRDWIVSIAGDGSGFMLTMVIILAIMFTGIFWISGRKKRYTISSQGVHGHWHKMHRWLFWKIPDIAQLELTIPWQDMQYYTNAKRRAAIGLKIFTNNGDAYAFFCYGADKTYAQFMQAFEAAYEAYKTKEQSASTTN